MIIGEGDFITSSTADYRSAYAAELCGCLAAFQSIDHFLSELRESLKIELIFATDCLGVIRKLEKQAKVINMATKLHPIVREFSLLKSKRLKSVAFAKVEAHQDAVKSFDELTFFEQLNVKCDARAKVLILNVSEDEVIFFPLAFSSPHVMMSTNQLILNYPKDIRQHAYLIKCKDYLKKVLKIVNFSKIDWALRASIMTSIPK